MHPDFLRYRERNPGLWRSRVPHWSAFGNSHVLPANGVHVAVRQLESS
jgi:hypothetical protein